MSEDVLQADEAERAVLGALLIDPTLLPSLGSLTAANFYQPNHSTIFSAISEAVDSGERVDQLVIMETLRARGDLMRVGGAPYLHTLETSVPSTANATYYARIVGQAATRRDLLVYATQLRDACMTPDLDTALERAAELSVAIGATADELPTKQTDPLTDLFELGEFVKEASAPYDWVIPGLLERMDRVIVVDDGSTDGTGAVARQAGALVVRHTQNLGPGGATMTGMLVGSGDLMFALIYLLWLRNSGR